MAPLAVDPVALDGAGTAVISAGDGLGSAISTLTTTLAATHGMAGDDPAGAAFGRTYDSSASKLLEAMATTRNGLCRLGDGVRVSARNYSAANAMSNVSGHAQPLPVPHLTGSIAAPPAPSAIGTGVTAPAGWGWVSRYIGMIWPNGDPIKLRSAASAWTTAGTHFDIGGRLGGPTKSIGSQRIPEGPAMAVAFASANQNASGIQQHSATIATQLTSLAAKVDTVHAAILDLLSRICNPLTGLKEVWEFLTDDDEDEIEKIANDIRIVVDQFTTEVDALRQDIAKALSGAAIILSTMAQYAEKEWNHFLQDTYVGQTLNHAGQIAKGIFTEAEGFVKSTWTLNPTRAFVDPKGFWHSASDAFDKLEDLTGVNSWDTAKETWKTLGKDTLHWDEWGTNPSQAIGESAFDLATLAIPGGALSKLPKLGRIAGDIGDRSENLRPRTPVREPTPTRDGQPPRNDPPSGGKPEPATKSTQPMPPYGLTESKDPVGQKPAVETPSKPVAEPATPAEPTPTHQPTGTPPPTPSPTQGGAPTPYNPQSPTFDHHGPVAPVVPTLTPADLSALTHYTGPGHDELNDALRNGTADAAQRARADALNKALEKLPPHDGLVFRGTDLPPEVLERYQPGTVVSENGFLSASLDLSVAQSKAFAGNVEFRIFSSTGRDITAFSRSPTEREVLFPSNTPFYVMDRQIDPATGTTIIEMIEEEE